MTDAQNTQAPTTTASPVPSPESPLPAEAIAPPPTPPGANDLAASVNATPVPPANPEPAPAPSSSVDAAAPPREWARADFLWWSSAIASFGSTWPGYKHSDGTVTVIDPSGSILVTISPTRVASLLRERKGGTPLPDPSDFPRLPKEDDLIGAPDDKESNQ